MTDDKFPIFNAFTYPMVFDVRVINLFVKSLAGTEQNGS